MVELRSVDSKNYAWIKLPHIFLINAYSAYGKLVPEWHSFCLKVLRENMDIVKVWLSLTVSLKNQSDPVKANFDYLLQHLFVSLLIFFQFDQPAIISIFLTSAFSVLAFSIRKYLLRILERAYDSIITSCSFIKKRVHPLFVWQTTSIWWPKNYFSRRYNI